MRARGADEHVEVLGHGRRAVGVGVARAEPAAEVVDGELAECGERLDGPAERRGVEDLRADVDVQPVEAQAVRAAQALDRPPRVGRGQAELRIVLAGGHGGVGVGAHARDHAHEHGLLAADQALQAIDVVEVVDHHGAHAGLDRARQVLVGLRVAVQVDAPGVDAGGQRVHQLAGARDVAAQALLGERAQHRRAGERLGGEDGQRVGPARAELVAVLARALAQRRPRRPRRPACRTRRRGRAAGSRR